METSISISTEQLSIGYRTPSGVRNVENNINLRLKAGELICLIGPNGAGKSTLMKTLAGFIPPLSGDIMIGGKSLASFSGSEIAKTISVVLTERINVENMTVEELVGLGRSPYSDFWGKLSDDDRKVVNDALGIVGIEEFSTRNLSSLSDGERQKAMIAKAIAQETPIIILDEPTAFLDYPSKAEIMLLLKELAYSKGKTILLSTHDLEIALQIADKLLLMDKKYGVTSGATETMVQEGQIDRYFNSPRLHFDKKNHTFRLATTIPGQHGNAMIC